MSEDPQTRTCPICGGTVTLHDYEHGEVRPHARPGPMWDQVLCRDSERVLRERGKRLFGYRKMGHRLVVLREQRGQP